MPFLGAGSGVELPYYDDDFVNSWQSAPTMLLQHGFSLSGKSGITGYPCCRVNSVSCAPMCEAWAGPTLTWTNSSLPWTSLSMT